MVIEVLHFNWGYDGGELPGGRHEIDKPSVALLEQIGAAAATTDPAVRVIEATKDERSKMDKAVQSQADGEKAYNAAQKDGSWQEGNLRAHIAATGARLDLLNALEKKGYEVDADAQAGLTVSLASSEAILEQVESGMTYDEAVDAVKGGDS